MDNRLNVKDLIDVGVFTAIYYVLFFISGMTGYIPIFIILFPFVMVILTGIPFTLFLTRVKKFGMVTLMGTILGLITFAMGYGWLVIATGVGCSLIADLILKSGGYKSWTKSVIGFCVFSEWVVGSMLPMWIMKDAYFAAVRTGQGDEYTDMAVSLITNGTLVLVIAGIVVVGIIAAYLGRSTLKKHFERAGIA